MKRLFLLPLQRRPTVHFSSDYRSVIHATQFDPHREMPEVNETGENTGTFTCDHVCISTSTNIAVALHDAVCRAVVYQSSLLSSDASKVKTANALAEELEEELLSTLKVGEKRLSDLLSVLEGWTAKKRGVMSGVLAALTGTVDSAVAKTEELLVREDAWAEGDRHRLAVTLVRGGYDCDNQAHCSSCYGGEEALYEHKMICPFRPVSCPNDGCPCSFSLRQQDKHDARCAFKLIDCVLECGELVMRREMKEHTLGPCNMKGVQCPYHDLGCSDPVRQGDLANHLTQNVDNHLRMLFESKSKLTGRVGDLERWATAVTEENESRFQGLKALDTALLALETKHVDMHKDYSGSKQAQTKLESRVKHLESTVDKQNKELAAMRKTLDGLLKSFAQIPKT